MTLVLDLDLHVLQTYLRPRFQKLESDMGQTDRQTHRCDRTHYHVAFGGEINLSLTTALFNKHYFVGISLTNICLITSHICAIQQITQTWYTGS